MMGRPLVRVAQPPPECLEPYCGAALTKEAAERNEGYCTPHLTRHPLIWQRVRDRARAAAQERAKAAGRDAVKRREDEARARRRQVLR